MGVKVKLKNVRLSFASKLWTPSAFQDGDNNRYGCNFIVEKGSENDKAIRAAINTVATEAWGAKANAQLKALAPDVGKFFYQNGDLKEYEGYEGMWYVSANRAEKDGPPAVVGRKGSADVVTEADGIIYSGCHVNAVIEVWCQSKKYTGIRATLNGVQFVKDGESFGGTSRASADDFDALDETTDDDFGDADEFGAPEPTKVDEFGSPEDSYAPF